MRSTKNILNRWLAVLLLSAIVTGCKKDFLEVVPKGKVIASKTNDYHLMLNDEAWIYTSPEPYLGDDVCAIEPYFNSAPLSKQRAFRYEDEIYPEGDSPGDLVGNSFANLYLVNKIITEVMDSEEGTEDQKKAILAEARAFRAWENLTLINRFAIPYNAATAANDLGFPIITTYDVTQKFTEKATIQEMYDFILKDLTEAIPNLSPRILHTQRISQPAGETILAKVYWMMGRYADALPLLNKAFAGLSNTNFPIQLNDYNKTTLVGGLQEPTSSGPKKLPYPSGDPECIFLRTSLPHSANNQSYVLVSPMASALYHPSDIRFTKFLWNRPFASATPFPVPGMYQKVGFLRGMIGVALPDMYLMRAECRARGNDLAGAVSDLETLRKNRMPAANAVVPASLSREDLVRYIVDERVREFAAIGLRWFDMRRLSADPLFAGRIGYVHTLYSATGAVKETYNLRPARFAFRIPPRILQENPGLESNP